MKKVLFYLSIFFCFNLIACSSEENIDSNEGQDLSDDINSEENDDSWRKIDIVGKWHLEYIIETNHDGIHVGSKEIIESTEYNYVDYEFKSDNTFIKTISEGESSNDVEVSVLKGTYDARKPENYSGDWLELRYEDGDWSDKEFEFNHDKTEMKIDIGTTTVNCGCSDNKYDYEEVYILLE